jgi:hypothetical protein
MGMNWTELHRIESYGNFRDHGSELTVPWKYYYLLLHHKLISRRNHFIDVRLSDVVRTSDHSNETMAMKGEL